MMLHPSYTELMNVINKDSSEDNPVISSRFSIVMATAKRARQIIAGDALVTPKEAEKPLSTAVTELEQGLIKILPESEEDEEPLVSSVVSDLDLGSDADSDEEESESDESGDEEDDSEEDTDEEDE